MTTVIPQVENQPYVYNAEFVKMVVTKMDNTTEIYTFSSSYKIETIDGVEYQPLGGLMSVGLQQRDMRVSTFDTTIAISGIGPENIYAVLATKIKGSLITIYRGFYTNNYILDNTVLRFNGVITSYAITEDIDFDENSDTFTIALNCSAFKTVLEQRIAGRLTSPNYWNQYPDAPTLSVDSSMVNVPNLVNAFFDFGKQVTNSGTSS